MLMAMCMMGNGRMIKHMVEVFILTLMVHNMMVNGLKTVNAVKDMNVGLMVLHIKEHMLMVKSME